MRRLLRLPPVLLLVASCSSLCAAAQAVGVEAISDVSVTLYRAPSRPAGSLDLDRLGGFALVSETRTVTIPAGDSQLRFEGVADGIEAASAIITGLPAGLLEKNRDAAVLSPSALVAAALGRSVLIVRTDPATGKQTRTPGTIESDAEGGVLFATSEGIEALRCSGLPETLSFSNNTDLAPTPTLSARVRSQEAVTATITLSYLAQGFDWTANYVATLSRDEKSMDLGAWVTLANGNGVTFPSANTQVVAGRLNRESGNVEPLDTGESILANCWPRGSTSDPVNEPDIRRASPLGTPDSPELMMSARRRKESDTILPIAMSVSAAQLVEEEQLGDLKLYRVPERTTLTSRQIKQVRLLDRHGVPIQIFYSADLEANQSVPFSAARKALRTWNNLEHHLGLPLPSGHVASFSTRQGAELLLDEAPLRDVAVGEQFEIGIDDSPDVQVNAVQEQSHVSLRKASTPPSLRGVLHQPSATVDDVNRVEIRNAKRAAIHFEVRLQLPDGTQLIRADPVPGARDGRPLFELVIPAGGSAIVRYQTEH